MRRLVETLIVEVFEKHEMAAKIQTSSGDFYSSRRLLGRSSASRLGVSAGQLGERYLREAARDNSAHSRRFNAHRGDVDNVQIGFRTAVQELIGLAELRD